MTLTPDHIFTIITALFGLCLAVGGYVVRDALGRIKELEARQCLDKESHAEICESAQQRVIIAKSKSDEALHRKMNKVIAIVYLIAGTLKVDIKGIDPE